MSSGRLDVSLRKEDNLSYLSLDQEERMDKDTSRCIDSLWGDGVPVSNVYFLCQGGGAITCGK